MTNTDKQEFEEIVRKIMEIFFKSGDPENMNLHEIAAHETLDKAFDEALADGWKVGDIAQTPVGAGEIVAEVFEYDHSAWVIQLESTYVIYKEEYLSKETPDQRKEREYEENGKALHDQASKTKPAIESYFFDLWDNMEEVAREHYRELAHTIGYKKDGE